MCTYLKVDGVRAIGNIENDCIGVLQGDSSPLNEVCRPTGGREHIRPSNILENHQAVRKIDGAPTGAVECEFVTLQNVAADGPDAIRVSAANCKGQSRPVVDKEVASVSVS